MIGGFAAKHRVENTEAHRVIRFEPVRIAGPDEDKITHAQRLGAAIDPMGGAALLDQKKLLIVMVMQR